MRFAILRRSLAVAAAVCCCAAQQSSLVEEAKITPTPRPAIPDPRPITPEMRADIHMARKEYRDALAIYRTLKPVTHALANKMGIAYHQLVELGLAKRHYEQAIKLKPDYAEAVNNLGTIYYATRSYRRAVNQYKKALKLNPYSASIHSNLGTAYFARKNYRAAMDSYQKALELDPEVFEHRGSHGVLLQERSVAERAKFHFYLAKTYAKAGVVDRALLYIRKALEEGFTERKKLVEDPEFAGLQSNPEFQELLKLQPRVL
jgi:tetratricopeptide (TPR) repeat protein